VKVECSILVRLVRVVARDSHSIPDPTDPEVSSHTQPMGDKGARGVPSSQGDKVAMEDPFSLEVRPEAKAVSSFPTEVAKVNSFPLTKVV